MAAEACPSRRCTALTFGLAVEHPRSDLRPFALIRARQRTLPLGVTLRWMLTGPDCSRYVSPPAFRTGRDRAQSDPYIIGRKNLNATGRVGRESMSAAFGVRAAIETRQPCRGPCLKLHRRFCKPGLLLLMAGGR